mmetsp:Transcript_24266/g.43466  ORF Transcript_24266/g.43466 Transcript_24266/m.43466 type:complete len:91 (+) Transcript_24266:1257-1529(+)
MLEKICHNQSHILPTDVPEKKGHLLEYYYNDQHSVALNNPIQGDPQHVRLKLKPPRLVCRNIEIHLFQEIPNHAQQHKKANAALRKVPYR